MSQSDEEISTKNKSPSSIDSTQLITNTNSIQEITNFTTEFNNEQELSVDSLLIQPLPSSTTTPPQSPQPSPPTSSSLVVSSTSSQQVAAEDNLPTSSERNLLNENHINSDEKEEQEIKENGIDSQNLYQLPLNDDEGLLTERNDNASTPSEPTDQQPDMSENGIYSINIGETNVSPTSRSRPRILLPTPRMPPSMVMPRPFFAASATSAVSPGGTAVVDAATGAAPVAASSSTSTTTSTYHPQQRPTKTTTDSLQHVHSIHYPYGPPPAPHTVDTSVPPPFMPPPMPHMDPSLLRPPAFNVASSSTADYSSHFMFSNRYSTMPTTPSASLSQLETWYESIKTYEQQMVSYFETCSSQLHNWHQNGAGETIEYENEYKKLMIDYENYLQYVNEMHKYYNQQKQQLTLAVGVGAVSSSTDSNVGRGNISKLSKMIIPQPPAELSLSGLTTDPHGDEAKRYSRYYKQMIKYFESLLKATGANTAAAAAATTTVNNASHGKRKKILSKSQKKKQRTLKAKWGKYNEEEMEEDEEDGQENEGPRIMENYRESFGETFDWASWHSYLSTMSRVNPQWYQEFKEQSKLKAIDWDKMYEEWALARGITPVAITPQQNQLLSSTTTNMITAAHQGKPTESSNEDEDEEDSDEDWSFCALCDQHFTNENGYLRHLRGLIHTQRVLEKKSRKNPIAFAEEVQKESEAIANDVTAEEKHIQWVIEQSRTQKTKGLGLKGSFYCSLCSVEVNSEKALEYHLNGQKHKGNLELLKITGEVPVPETKTDENKPTVRIQPILDQCVDALIGLNYVTEYQRDDPSADCRYYCELCDSRFLPKKVMNHLTGTQHRKTYMKFNYSDLYEIADQDQGTAEVKKKRIEIFAKKIEEHEGRKKMSIKREISNILVKQQKRKEAIKKNREVKAKEKRLAEEMARKKTKELQEKRIQRAKKREIRHREKAKAYLYQERLNRLAMGNNVNEEGDLEEGEIPSDIDDDEYHPPESAIQEAMKRLRMSESSESESEYLIASGAVLDALEEEEEEEEGYSATLKEDDDDAFDDIEMAEFEDVFRSSRQPLSLNLPEDPERDDFIRHIKKKKLLRIKQISSKYIVQFTLEAEWALERAKAMEELRKNNSKKSKDSSYHHHHHQQQQQQHHLSRHQHHQSHTSCLLPSFSHEMGPNLPMMYPPPPFYAQPPLYPPPPTAAAVPLSTPLSSSQLSTTMNNPPPPPPPPPARESLSIENMRKTIMSVTGLPMKPILSNVPPPPPPSSLLSSVTPAAVVTTTGVASTENLRKRAGLLPTPEDLVVVTAAKQARLDSTTGLLLPPFCVASTDNKSSSTTTTSSASPSTNSIPLLPPPSLLQQPSTQHHSLSSSSSLTNVPVTVVVTNNDDDDNNNDDDNIPSSS